MALHLRRQERLLTKLALNRSGQFFLQTLHVEVLTVLGHREDVPGEDPVADPQVIGQAALAAVGLAAQLALGLGGRSRGVTSGFGRPSRMGRSNVGVEVVLAEVDVAAVLTLESRILLVLLLKDIPFLTSAENTRGQWSHGWSSFLLGERPGFDPSSLF